MNPPPQHTGAPRGTWWLIVAATATLMVTMGIRQSLGLFVQPIARDTALGIVEISFALAVAQLVWGIVQPLFGAWADKTGPGRVLVAGGLLLVLGMDRTTLSRDLKPLLAAGWIEPVEGADARQRPVRATTAGRRAVAKAMPLWRAVQDEIETLLGGERTARLHAQLDFALARLQEDA